jgi:hypothetical protein
MLEVVAMLSSKTMVLVEPKHPAYFNLIRVGNEDTSVAARPSSINGMTISATTGRFFLRLRNQVPASTVNRTVYSQITKPSSTQTARAKTLPDPKGHYKGPNTT